MGSWLSSRSLGWTLQTSADFISFVRSRQRICATVSARNYGLTSIWCLPYFDYETRQSDQTIPVEVFYDGD